ncbi:hypothetical protein acdb102_36660 [Acidothermaceae bacterium B102]|nr:hypothetical protein acdb102_36660 [Acidothermaceae bacterium B102]
MEFHHKFVAGAAAVVVTAVVGYTVQLYGPAATTTVVGPAPATVFAGALPSVTTLGPAPTRGLDLGDAPTLAEALPRLELFVEEARGRQFKHQLAVAPLSDQAFAEHLREDDGPASINPGWDATLVALHLVPPGYDFSSTRSQQSSEVGGYYDFASKSLFVRSAVLNPLAQSILAHELTHALDDQYTSLDDLSQQGENQDQSEAIQSLIEGDARWVEDQFSNALTDQRQAQEAAEAKAQYGAAASADAVPAVFQELSAFPYDSGSDFVQNLRNEGGRAAVDAAFANPPISTLQILEAADDFQHRVDPVDVPEPGTAAGREIDNGTLGVLLLASVTSEGAPPGGADDPRLRQWAGDDYETVQSGDQTCVRDAIESASGGLAALRDSLSTWTAGVHGASVTVTGPTSLLLVSCTG